MSQNEIHAYENLLLLCPNHHRLIDGLEPEEHSRYRLLAMKQAHEERCAKPEWASESTLDSLARDLLISSGSIGQPIAGSPRLVARNEQKGVMITNVGSSDAHAIRVLPKDERTSDAYIPLGSVPAIISPSGQWRAGRHAATLGNSGGHVLQVTWTDDLGTLFSGEYPL